MLQAPQLSPAPSRPHLRLVGEGTGSGRPGRSWPVSPRLLALLLVVSLVLVLSWDAGGLWRLAGSVLSLGVAAGVVADSVLVMQG